MYKQKGTYSSYIHMYMDGSPERELLRNALKFYDVNAFVTLWITSILLEVDHFARMDSERATPTSERATPTYESVTPISERATPTYKSATPIVTDRQLVEAINATATYHDRNIKGDTSLFVFWPQKYNRSTDAWVCSPTNLEGIVQSDERIFDYVHKILDDLGLSSLWDKIEPTIHEL